MFYTLDKEQGTPQPKAPATKVTLILEKATKTLLYIDKARCKYKKVLVEDIFP